MDSQPSNLGLFGNMDRALESAEQTRLLLVLPAVDLILPGYSEVMLPTLDACDGFGLVCYQDERSDVGFPVETLRSTPRRAWSYGALSREIQHAERGKMRLLVGPPAWPTLLFAN